MVPWSDNTSAEVPEEKRSARPVAVASVKVLALLNDGVADARPHEFLRNWHWLGLTVLGLASFGVRFRILGRYAALPSPDFGLYLGQANFLTGQDVSGLGQVLPPAYIVVLLGMIQALDPMLALRFFAAVPTAFLPVPFFFLVARFAARPFAMLAAALFVFAEGFSEMTAWGGAPEFFAMTFLMGSVLFLLRYLEAGANRDLLLASACASLVVGAHPLSASVLVLSAAVWAGSEILRTRKRGVAIAFAKYTGLAALFSIPYVPSYLNVTRDMAPPSKSLGPEGFVEVFRALEFLMRETVLLWILVVAFGLAGGLIVLRRKPEGTLFASMTAVVFLLSLTLVRDNPARPLYYLYIPILATYPAFLEWIWKVELRRLPARTARTVGVGLVVFLLLSSGTMVWLSNSRMSVAVDFYHAIEEPELEALDWLRENTSRDSVVATAGLPFTVQSEGTRFAWWIEGYAQRRAFFAGSLIYASYRAERDAVENANRFFTGNRVLDNGGLRIIENFPADRANPEIWANVGGEYRFLLFFNEAVSAVRYAPDAAPGSNATWSPSYLTPGNASWSGASGFETTRVDGNISLRRTASLDQDRVVLDVTALVTNGTLLEVDAPVWLGWGRFLENVAVTAGRVTGLVAGPDQPGIPFELTVSTSPATSFVIEPTNSDPLYQLPVILVSAQPASAASNLTIRFDFRFPTIAVGPTSRSDAFSIAAAYRVTHVYQSKRLPDMHHRFRYDEIHFQLAYDNVRVSVFEVVSFASG